MVGGFWSWSGPGDESEPGCARVSSEEDMRELQGWWGLEQGLIKKEELDVQV